MGARLTIGKLAKAAGVPVSTVRYYEQRGLIAPDRRTASSYRIFGPANLERLRFIRAAQAYGFTLEDIGMLLEIRSGAVDPCAEVQRILERRLLRVEERLAELARARDVLSESIEWCRAPHAAGCCQVIEELDSVAESPGSNAPEAEMPSTPDEIARALLHGLRGSLPNARIYVVVKRLLGRGCPVSPGEVAEILEEPLGEVLVALGRVPAIEWNPEGNILGWGLTLKPTPHRFEVEGSTLFTWCAFDTLFFPSLLGRTAAIHSTCPHSGEDIHVTVRPDGIDAVEPKEAVVSVVLPDRGAARTDVRAAFCDMVHYFKDREAASEWLESHPSGIVLSVEDAFGVGHALSSLVLAEAGEA